MIPLSGRAAHVNLAEPLARRVWQLEDAETQTGQRRARACLVDNEASVPSGFDLYLTKPGVHLGETVNWIELPPKLD